MINLKEGNNTQINFFKNSTQQVALGKQQNQMMGQNTRKSQSTGRTGMMNR